jgi:hypothetical protein
MFLAVETAFHRTVAQRQSTPTWWMAPEHGRGIGLPFGPGASTGAAS